MPQLSIVIPALGGPALLESGLVSVLQHRPHDVEVIVVLTEPYADPYELKEEIRFVEARRRAGLVECLRVGLAASDAPLVHFLASGARVANDWVAAALRHFNDPGIAAVAPFIQRGEGREVSLSAGVVYRPGGIRLVSPVGNRTQSVLGPEIEAAFFRREAIERAGGLARNLGDELADVDLALALAHAGYRSVVEPASRVLMSPVAGSRYGGFRQGLYAQRLFWRNVPAAGWFRSLIRHPAVVASKCLEMRPRLAGVTHLLGRVAASVDVPHYLARHRHLGRLSRHHTPTPIHAPHRQPNQPAIDPPVARRAAAPPQTSPVIVLPSVSDLARDEFAR